MPKQINEPVQFLNELLLLPHLAPAPVLIGPVAQRMEWGNWREEATPPGAGMKKLKH